MADLLEALLQIKALAETPERVARLLDSTDPSLWAARRRPAEPAPVEILAALDEAELVFVRCVRLVISSKRPQLPVTENVVHTEPGRADRPAPATVLERFRTRRGESVDLLASCSAAQLERVGVHPVRKVVSLADLVAIKLADDTDRVGQLRERLGTGRPPEARPKGS